MEQGSQLRLWGTPDTQNFSSAAVPRNRTQLDLIADRTIAVVIQATQLLLLPDGKPQAAS